MQNQATPDTLIIEADTVEDALAELHGRLGPAARILRADRVTRGGIAGFFARQVVEIEAISDRGPEHTASPVARTTLSGPSGVDRVLAGLVDSADDQSSTEHTFADLLGRRLSEAPHDPDTEPPRSTPERREAIEEGIRHRTQARRAPSVRWDIQRLLDAGVPERIVAACAGLDPTDDAGHLTALAALIAAMCGPLPDGPALLVGRGASRLSAALGGLEFRTGYTHLVVDGSVPPTGGVADVVSWSSEAGAPSALAMAAATGATLGYGMSSGFGAPARRITPIDAALALRELMERDE